MRVAPYVPPTRPSIMIVGEAPGETEEAHGKPFVGASGSELRHMLKLMGIDPDLCWITNVFWQRPPNNDLTAWCVSAKAVEAQMGLPAIKPGKYLQRKYYKDVSEFDVAVLAAAAERYGVSISDAPTNILERLTLEIKIAQPNLIIALGGTATWALLRNEKITQLRGIVAEGVLAPVKVLPTFHPAYMMRVWAVRPTIFADLAKARRESTYPEIRRPQRGVWINPTLDDIAKFCREELVPGRTLAFDIETKRKQISMISFSTRPEYALVVPFISGDSGHYWDTLEKEAQALRLVHYILTSPLPKVGQNGLFDIFYIWITWGIPVENYHHDTMILHHALYPELPKGLGYMASYLTDETSWKLWRARGTEDIKGDD